MSEENLAELLERTADRHEISTPPLDQMLTRSRRARKRRAVVIALAASVVVGSAIIGTTSLFNPSGSAPGTSHPSDQEIVPWKAITPGPSPSPDLAVPLDGEPIDVSLILPGYERQSVPDAARYEFVVRLTNAGDRPVSLDPCPFYRVAFVKDVETGYLNCGQAPSEVAAAGHVDFAMEAPAHDAEMLAREGGNSFVLTWELGTEGVEGAMATGTAHLAGSTDPINLEGEWTLDALVGPDGNSALNDSYAERGRLSFEDGRFEGTAGCNSISGIYRQSGGGRDLALARIGTTKMACPDEPPLRERLLDVRHVSEANGKLQLHAENWMIIAVLERVDSNPPA